METEFSLVGKTVKEVRQMNKSEMEQEGWDYGTTVIVFADGTKIYASQDDEGNGPGTMFGRTPADDSVYVG